MVGSVRRVVAAKECARRCQEANESYSQVFAGEPEGYCVFPRR